MIDSLVLSIFISKTHLRFGELFLLAVTEGTEVSSSLPVGVVASQATVMKLEKLQSSVSNHAFVSPPLH